MKICVLLLVCLLQLPLFCSLPVQYGFYAQRQSKGPITKFSLFSQRCSGSNYLHTLMCTNLELTAEPFCHKHFPPWYELSLENYKGDPRHYTFENTDDFLFVIIVRNPYDWVRSLQENPWHAATHLHGRPFSEFIRTPWELLSEDLDYVVRNHLQANPLIERNPKNGALFENVFALRTAKIRNMLSIKHRAKNVYYVNYEVVRDFPKEVIQEMSRLFSVNPKTTFEPVTKHLGGIPGGAEYKPKNYVTVSLDDLLYINSQLDEMLEHEIGYTLIDTPEELTVYAPTC